MRFPAEKDIFFCTRANRLPKVSEVVLARPSVSDRHSRVGKNDCAGALMVERILDRILEFDEIALKVVN